MGVEDEFAWFVMDYVESPDGVPKNLGEVPQAGELPEKQIAGWYEDVRTALAFVHASGVVHRDVKLQNILVEPAGTSMYCVKGESGKTLHGCGRWDWRGCIHPRFAGFRGTMVPLMGAGAKPQCCHGIWRAPTMSGTGRAPLVASVRLGSLRCRDA